MNYKRYILVLILFLLQTNFCIGDDKNSTTVFGQEPPGNIPQIFAPGIISTKNFEFSLTISADNNEIYFTRRDTYEGWENRIFFSKMENGKLTNPVRAPFSEDYFEFSPSITPNGNTLYFFTERKKENENIKGNLWYTQKIENQWTKPQQLNTDFNIPFNMTISSTKEGTLYYSANIDGKTGIYRSKENQGTFTKPEYLPQEINYLHAAHPFIAQDESYMIFDSQVSGRGLPELYISFKLDDTSWTKAVNMGEKINVTKTEFGASVTKDGKYLFFHRRNGTKGDIYWVDSKVIDIIKRKEKK